MRYSILLKSFILITSFSNICLAQLPKSDFTILNCVPIKGDFLFAAQTELTNFQYLEFLSSVEKTKGKEYVKQMTPDSTVWNMPMGNNQKYVEYYFRHPAYRNHPVVGITKLQALEYCKWLEETLNKLENNNPKSCVQKLIVRLPTDEEWQNAAKAGDVNALFPWEGSEMRRTDNKFKGATQANYIRDTESFTNPQGNPNNSYDIIAPVESYWPNKYRIYNMSGNVAEMLQEEGRTRGGSWASRAPYLEINGKDEFQGFTKPSAKIGFRYFIEIVDFKDIKQTTPFELSAKIIEDYLISQNENLFIGKYEVSNEFYNLFLTEKWNEKYSPNNELWLNKIEYSNQYFNDYNTLSEYKNHPVVNISKEDALAFCSWLTKKYESFEDRKYKGMVFNLPTELEWKFAAKGNLNLSPFPWGGENTTLPNGEYLCNYNPVEDRWIIDIDSSVLISGLSKQEIQLAGMRDGFLISCPVDSYNPNSIGLYNICGNVAEMILDKNLTKGGSWGSFPKELKIEASEEFTEPSPYVGFRIFGVIK